jgi:hypothetical protein
VADTTEFSHDQLGHILSDHLVAVPEFQRSYAWEAINVQEYLADLERAREKGTAYFMGTLVFASPSDGNTRRIIVDGQQRLATTAILMLRFATDCASSAGTTLRTTHPDNSSAASASRKRERLTV